MYRILLIDDDHFISSSIAQILSMNGYDVASADDDVSGIALAHNFQPDMILCDRMLGNSDGCDVLLALRSHPHTANIPFVFLTGMTDQAHIREGLNAGADDYLLKPFAIDTLLGVVSVWIEYRRGTELQTRAR